MFFMINCSFVVEYQQNVTEMDEIMGQSCFRARTKNCIKTQTRTRYTLFLIN